MKTVTAVTYARKEYVLSSFLYPLLWLIPLSQIALSDSGDVWRLDSSKSGYECRFCRVSGGITAHG